MRLCRYFYPGKKRAIKHYTEPYALFNTNWKDLNLQISYTKENLYLKKINNVFLSAEKACCSKANFRFVQANNILPGLIQIIVSVTSVRKFSITLII